MSIHYWISYIICIIHNWIIKIHYQVLHSAEFMIIAFFSTFILQ